MPRYFMLCCSHRKGKRGFSWSASDRGRLMFRISDMDKFILKLEVWKVEKDDIRFGSEMHGCWIKNKMSSA